ncbi:MAG: hypothetical protein U1F43_04800 [Myxococcota bacterium]
MTDAPALPQPALDFVNEDEPTPLALGGLDGLSPTAYEALVRVLEQRELLDHLEALAGLAAAPKDIKKAASASAYKLRSKGVKSRLKPAAAGAAAGGGKVELRPVEPVDLGKVALAAPPGMLGRFWLLLGTLPGATALEVKGDADGGVEGLDVLRQVSTSKVEKLAREFESKRVRGLPVRASADLAVRLVDSWTEAMPPERRPPLWAQVLEWRQVAVGLGAEPRRASARANLAPTERALTPEALHAYEGGGLHLPTPGVVQRILSGMRALLDKPAIEAAAVDRKAADLFLESIGSWLSSPATRARLSRWLEATADVLYTNKQWPPAVAFLQLADHIARASDGYALAQEPFFRAVERELLGADSQRQAAR